MTRHDPAADTRLTWTDSRLVRGGKDSACGAYRIVPVARGHYTLFAWGVQTDHGGVYQRDFASLELAQNHAELLEAGRNRAESPWSAMEVLQREG